jgi:hypothetical protein
MKQLNEVGALQPDGSGRFTIERGPDQDCGYRDVTDACCQLGDSSQLGPNDLIEQKHSCDTPSISGGCTHLAL